MIPAAGFYEWSRQKEKNTFYRKDGKPLYLAGFYDRFDKEDRFVILTTVANASMRPVHDRMPPCSGKRPDQILAMGGKAGTRNAASDSCPFGTVCAL